MMVLTMNAILLIEVLDYHQTPPTVAVRFWWSADLGVTCDQPRTFAELAHHGIRTWRGGEAKTVFPKDGRPFFDALPLRFSGTWRAQPSVPVSHQGGESLP